MSKEIIPFEEFGAENLIFLKDYVLNFKKAAALKNESGYRKFVNEFETEFGGFNGSKFCMAVNSGTTALELALRAHAISPGDEVLLPAYTYISTALAISNLGATPRFVDVKSDTWTIDPEKIEKNLSKKTKAMVVVHIHGNPCDMTSIMTIANNKKLPVVEDCSHAHGATFKNIKVGNFGIGCFSCHPSKNFGCIGNGGIITSNVRDVFENISKQLDICSDPDSTLSPRVPCRMDVIQAAILRTKLPSLEKMNAKRHALARAYGRALTGTVTFQKIEPCAFHVYRDVVIKTDERDQLKDYLMRHGVETKIRYSIPLHLTSYYKTLGYKKGDLPVTEDICRSILHLPCRMTLKHASLTAMCRLICHFFRKT